jgi:hypothetical protein
MQEPTEIRLTKTDAADAEISAAIKTYLRETKKAAEHELKAGEARKTIHEFASRQWLRTYQRGFVPGSPFRLFTDDLKASVKFIVQDGTDGAELKPGAYDEIRAIVGDDDADALTEETYSVKLDQKVLDQEAPGRSGLRVRDVLAAELGTFRYELEERGVLTREQAAGFLSIRPARVIRPNFLARLPVVTGLSSSKLGRVLETIGGSLKRFVQA